MRKTHSHSELSVQKFSDIRLTEIVVPFSTGIELTCSLHKLDFSNTGTHFSNTDQILKAWFLQCLFYLSITSASIKWSRIHSLQHAHLHRVTGISPAAHLRF